MRGIISGPLNAPSNTRLPMRNDVCPWRGATVICLQQVRVPGWPLGIMLNFNVLCHGAAMGMAEESRTVNRPIDSPTGHKSVHRCVERVCVRVRMCEL